VSTDTTSAIEVDGLTVRFDELVALDRVSLSVPFGSVSGLLGRNGAGKSTCINVLSGLLFPDDGRVRVCSVDPSVPGSALAHCAGYVLSRDALFDYLTAHEFLTFVGAAFELPSNVASERISSLMEFFELHEVEDTLVRDYSTGYRKRLAMAAALVQNPRVLILDEPFEALDPSMVARLQQLLRAFADRGGAVLVSSHLLGVLQDLCNHVFVLDHGRIRFGGPIGAARPPDGETGGGRSLGEFFAAIDAPAPPPPAWLGGWKNPPP